MLVRATGRHHYRPAHLHFLIFKPGFKTLISQIYVNDDDGWKPTCSSASPARWSATMSATTGRRRRPT